MSDQTNNRINFNENWNGKLLCNCFTTIRLFDVKYELGGIYDIALKDKVSGPAEIVFLKEITLNQITVAMAYTDIGYSPTQAREMIKQFYPSVPDIENAKFIYIVLKRTTQDVNLSNQIDKIGTIQAADIPIQR
ncbi:hypothetical protein [Pedobacter miscanthi]|uniref:hypothetical protein n=1 Tax=Pedobacter miscanthi TaxID=2259170 RepID=UPI002930A68C|nr:hypothetical protein [Pedobacter miscanthi]